MRSYRRLVSTSFINLAVVLSLAGCGGSSTDLFVNMQWQVKCDGQNDCLQGDHLPHDAFDFAPGTTEDVFIPGTSTISAGEDFRASCRLTELENGNLSWDFEIEAVSFSFAVRQAEIPSGGGLLTGDSCEVTVTDDSNTFQGACGSAATSADQPCRFTSVGLVNDEVVTGLSGPTLQTTVQCDALPSPNNTSIQRNIRSFDQGSAASIVIVHCDGRGALFR